jgi:hypothetical protein
MKSGINYGLTIIAMLFFCDVALAQAPRWTSFFQARPNSGLRVNDLALDRTGNVYVVGEFGDTADFDPGPGETILAGQFANFILKLDSNGALVWAKAIDAFVFENTNGIAVDSSGNVYVAGRFRDTCDFDPGPGTYYLSAMGNIDAYVLKLNTHGDFEWARSAGGWDYDGADDIAVDGRNVCVAGFFKQTADFDPGPGTANLTAHAIFYDTFIWNLDSDGNYLWAKNIGGGGDVVTRSITMDHTGHILAAGTFGGVVDFDPGPGSFPLRSDSLWPSIFILKIDTSGSFRWAKPILGSASKYIGGISVDRADAVYATGEFRDTIVFGPGNPAQVLSSVHPNAFDAFICKLDSLGACVWAKSFSGGRNANNGVAGFGLAVDDSNNVYSAGVYRDSVDFDPSPTGTAFLGTSTLDYYMYVNKLDSNGDYVWVRSDGLMATPPALSLDQGGNIYGSSASHVFKWAGRIQATQVPAGGPAVSCNNLVIAPVPASESIMIRCPCREWHAKAALIFDIIGRQVFQFNIAETVVIDIGAWLPGVYQLRLPGGEWRKFVKQ